MSQLLVTTPDPSLSAELAARTAADVRVWDLTGPPPADRIDMVVPPYMGSPRPLGVLAGLDVRLIQSQSIGYDHVADFLPAGHVYANAAGVHEASTAELAVALILAAQRQLPALVRDADAERWNRPFTPSLADRRVTIIGVGGVGRAIIARLAPFEVELRRVGRTRREDAEGLVYGTADLPAVLPDSEIVVVAVPLTPQTTRMVDRAFLALLPAGALLVNVARGAVADTDALVEFSAAGRVRLALDVVDPEPLPAGHPLYHQVTVLTPHIGGYTTAMRPRLLRLFADQLERLDSGREPLNVVLRT